MIKKSDLFKKKVFSVSPPIMVFFSFFIVIMFGAILLSLPISSESGKFTSFTDALYTATSATCVTGLVLFDTADYWSWFGEITILFLIQVGGLGLITLMTFFMSVMGRKSGLKSMVLAQESLNTFNWYDAIHLVRGVTAVVFGIEFIGAVILSASFVPQYGVIGIYYGIFHSVSAFCNAGFDVLGGLQSMSGQADNPIVLYTISILVMIGGLGFIVWQDIWSYKNVRKLRLHTKIVLVVSLALWIGGTIFVYIVEGQNVNTLGSIPTRERFDAAFFLSVNARTSGYASFNLYAMKDVTKIFISLLMFIGAASGSTGGGIKVNTIGILLIALFSVIRSTDDIIFNKKHISIQTVLRAFTIFLLSGVLLLFVIFVISLLIPQYRFVDTLFESTSAFGTVGLSIGLSTSPYYSDLAKYIHTITMFIGRVGPMTFAVTLTLRKQKRTTIIYPESKIVVG